MRHLRHLVLPAASLLCLLGATSPLAAVVVDASESPTGCALPPGVGDPDLSCWYSYTATRTDGAPVVVPGTKQLLNSLDYVCDNCGNKTTSKTCAISGTISQASSLTATVESNIKVGAAGIEAALKAALASGLTITNTITGSTTVIAGPKEKKITQFSIYFEGNRKATVTSTYSCTATESPWSPWICIPFSVTYPGGSRTSDGNASGFSGSIIDKTFDGECPE